MKKGCKYRITSSIVSDVEPCETELWYIGPSVVPIVCENDYEYDCTSNCIIDVKIDNSLTWEIVNRIDSIKKIRRKPYFRIGDVVRINTTYNVEHVLKITELFIDKFNNFITAGHNPNFEMSDVIKIKESQRYYWVKEVGYIWIPLDKIKSFEVL